MPKRKPPPEKRNWARIVNREWQLNLTSGEVLRPVRDLSKSEASEFGRSLPVFYLGFLIPVRDLSRDAASIAAELELTAVDIVGPEWNEVFLFRGDRGTEAVVIEHHH